VRDRAVIAVGIGTCAGVLGLVLLGVGTAAASSGPSPGPAAGPTPVVSASPATEPAAVDIGSPPLPEEPTAATSAVVAQQGPVPAGDGTLATTSGLPSTGGAVGRIVVLALGSTAVGIAAIVTSGRSPRRRRALTQR